MYALCVGYRGFGVAAVSWIIEVAVLDRMPVNAAGADQWMEGLIIHGTRAEVLNALTYIRRPGVRYRIRREKQGLD